MTQNYNMEDIIAESVKEKTMDCTIVSISGNHVVYYWNDATKRYNYTHRPDVMGPISAYGLEVGKRYRVTQAEFDTTKGKKAYFWLGVEELGQKKQAAPTQTPNNPLLDLFEF